MSTAQEACGDYLLPCSTTTTGNAFLMLVYGVIIAFGLRTNNLFACLLACVTRCAASCCVRVCCCCVCVCESGAKTIAAGSDLLLDMLHPGVIGGFVIPLLGLCLIALQQQQRSPNGPTGTLPDVLMVFVAGNGPDETVSEVIVCRHNTSKDFTSKQVQARKNGDSTRGWAHSLVAR